MLKQIVLMSLNFLPHFEVFVEYWWAKVDGLGTTAFPGETIGIKLHYYEITAPPPPQLMKQSMLREVR